MSSDITGVAAGSRESMGAASRETGLQTALVDDEHSRLLDQDRARLRSRFRVLFIYATLCVITFCVIWIRGTTTPFNAKETFLNNHKAMGGTEIDRHVCASGLVSLSWPSVVAVTMAMFHLGLGFRVVRSLVLIEEPLLRELDLDWDPAAILVGTLFPGLI